MSPMARTQWTDETWARRLWRRSRWAVRSLAPEREVTRTVQGVELRMPWSHRLPDYAAAVPAYGQNVVRLAEALGGDHTLPVVDVGANIGDTALQVLHRVDARVLCVEGDPHWLTWLR